MFLIVFGPNIICVNKEQINNNLSETVVDGTSVPLNGTLFFFKDNNI